MLKNFEINKIKNKINLIKLIKKILQKKNLDKNYWE